MRTLLVGILVCATSATAAAAPCKTAAGAEVSEGEARARVDQLASKLDRNRGHMRTWNITWFSIYTVAALTQGTLALTLDDGDDQRVYGVGGVRAAIAAAAVPLLGVRTRTVELTGDPCSDLAHVESVLGENARLHAEGRGWIKHAGVVGLNLAAFLTLGLGYDLWTRGAIGGAIGVVVGEVQIYTQPMGSREIAYEAPGAGPAAVFIAPTVSEDSVGVAITGLF